MNISKTVRDRAISSEFLTRRVVQEYFVPRGKISIFGTFGGHLGFSRKMKNCEYLETVRDTVISSEFLTCRVVEEYLMQRGNIFNFRHFWRPSWILAENQNKCEYLKKP